MNINQNFAIKSVLGVAFLTVMSLSHAETVIRYTDHEPLGNMRTTFLNDVLFANIAKETHGRVKIEPHWNGELSTSYEALPTIQTGTKADMTVVVPEYVAKQLPLHQLFKSFIVGPTGDKQVQFFRQAYRQIPELTQEVEQQHIKPIFLATGYPVAFFSNQPLTDLYAMQGQTWRTASFWHKELLQNVGSKPVTMPWNDGINKAIKAGKLQGLMVNIDSGYDLKAYENAPYVLTSPTLWLGHLYLISINEQTWQKLPKQDQQAIIRASEKSYRTLGKTMDTAYQNQIQALEKRGATVTVLPETQVKGWADASHYPTIQDNWATQQQAQGVESAPNVLAKMRAIWHRLI